MAIHLDKLECLMMVQCKGADLVAKYGLQTEESATDPANFRGLTTEIRNEDQRW